MSPVVKMIWAQSINLAIGKDNEIPWRIKEDFEYFKTMTLGCAVIMGKNTWLSLPESNRPLPGRRNIVLSRNPDSFEHEGAEVFPDLDSALTALHDEKTVWIIGGAGVYATAMPLASELHITFVRMHVEDADAFAPTRPRAFKKVASTRTQKSVSGVKYFIRIYERPKP